MTTTVEFAVQISCDSCVTKIENSLKNVEGVKNINISKDNGTVLVESSLPSSLLQEKIESTGRKAVLKGYGSDKGEREEFNFVKVEVDSSGCCAICKPNATESSKNVLYMDKKPQDSPSALDNPKDVEDKKEESEINAKSDSAGTPKKKKSKSDDEEELELKYSSDSEDGDFETRLIAFNTSDGEDIWKIEDDLDAEFDVIDADGDESEIEEKSSAEEKKDEKQKGRVNSADSTQPTTRLTNTQTSIDVINSDNETSKTEGNQSARRKRKLNSTAGKFMGEMNACKVRKGDFNVLNKHIALHILILPEKEGEHLEDSEAQKIKECIIKELYLRTLSFKAKEPGVFMLRFSDCKLVTPGWLLINCDNKETFDWLLSWKIPSVGSKTFQAIAALDKLPLQKIKFCVKSKWIPDGESMLKLIHLQNRDIDTKRWILDEKKPGPNGMEQFKFQVDFGSVRALEKLNWSFFYELFAVKVTEYNGKPVSTLSKNKNVKPVGT